MRYFLRLALGISPLMGLAQTSSSVPSPAQIDPTTCKDPLLQTLIQEALDHNPDLARARSFAEAETERIPQAKALPDPSLTLGLQNDGFKGLQVGKMETSYYQVMLTQPLPWPGKRGLRGEIASLEAETARAATERSRLSLVADVKRAYVGLLLVRGQMELLDQQILFAQKASEITKARYEVGQGSQADLLRAQLEQNRIRQTRYSLKRQEQVLVAELNRLRGLSPDRPLLTVAQLSDSELRNASPDSWTDRAEKESPELQAARIGIHQAERSLDLAKRERYPDFAVSAGIMPRGSLDPMWQVGFSVSLPLWSKQKQHRAVAEQEWRRRAQGSEIEGLRNLLSQRMHERTLQLNEALENIRLYKDGLLIQSEASFQASLAQYEAGRASFLSVLEALNGWVADKSGYLQTLAQAQAVMIAQDEFNLVGTPPIAATGLNAWAMGMGGNPGASLMSASPEKSGTASSKSGPAMNAM